MSHDHGRGCSDTHDHSDTHGHAAGEEAGGCCSNKPASECCKTAAPAGPLTVDQMEALGPVRLAQRYRRGIEVVDQRVLRLTEEQLDTAFLPEAGVGAWPARVLLGHCADAELVFVHRMRRAVGEDNPVVALWDENAFIDANIYGLQKHGYADDPEADHARVMHAVGGFLAVIHTLRQWHSAWLLSLDDSAWERRIMHPERGPMGVGRILAYATWHLEHHCGFLTRKLDRMGIPAIEPRGGGGGGCGSGCGCSH
jgi:uncharacterized damage-inducible protein DinB